MSKSKKITQTYAVASGEYSDYRILAVCTDESTAEAWAAALREDPETWHSDARVELVDEISPGVAPFRFSAVDLRQELRDDGSESPPAITEETCLAVGSLYGVPPLRPLVRFVRAPCHDGKGGRLEIRGRTRAGVLKVYGDAHRMWAANPRGYKAG